MFARKKRAKMLELAHQHDVTIVLEAHADRGDIVQMHATTHNTHHVAFSCTGSKRAGGIVVFIKMALLHTVSSLQAKIIVPGRALQLHFPSPFGTLTIVGLHLVPAWSHGLKKRVLTKVCNSFPPPDVAAGFLLADFNFNATGDITFDSSELLPRRRRDPISAYFDALFHRFLELEQPDYTRFGAGIYSRIDRIYTNIRTSSILDLKPIVGVSWRIQPSEIAPVSDHVPVFVVVNNQLSNSRKALPVWVAKRPEFTGFLQKCVDFNGGLSGDVCEALLEAKAFIRHAVKHVIAIAHAQEPTSTEEKTYRLIKAYRLAHNRDHTQYKKLASCYHDLYSFYDDDGGIWNMQALHDHLEALIRQDGEDKLHHIVQSASQPQTKQNRSAALVKWLRLWGAKNKRYMLSAISDSTGKVVHEKG